MNRGYQAKKEQFKKCFLTHAEVFGKAVNHTLSFLEAKADIATSRDYRR